MDWTGIERSDFGFLKGHGVVNGEGPSWAEFPIRPLVARKKENPSLQVLISVGGWLDAVNFPDMTFMPEIGLRFIDSVVGFVERYNLAGVDIDWEYPGQL